MGLKITHDGETAREARERCCICRRETNFWYTPKDVALCPSCARRTRRADVPTKEQWWAAETAIAARPKSTAPLPPSVLEPLRAAYRLSAAFFILREGKYAEVDPDLFVALRFAVGDIPPEIRAQIEGDQP